MSTNQQQEALLLSFFLFLSFFLVSLSFPISFSLLLNLFYFSLALFQFFLPSLIFSLPFYFFFLPLSFFFLSFFLSLFLSSHRLPSDVKFEGPLSKNDELSGAEKLYEDQLVGPESFATYQGKFSFPPFFFLFLSHFSLLLLPLPL